MCSTCVVKNVKLKPTSARVTREKWTIQKSKDVYSDEDYSAALEFKWR